MVGLAIATLGSVGCSQDGIAEPGVPVAYVEIDVGHNSGISSERLEVIRDEASLADLWRVHTTWQDPVPEQPQVDFSTNMVIAMFLGDKPTGGYGLEVVGVVEEMDRWVVQLRADSAGSGCGVTTAQTQPYRILSVPRSGKNVSFDIADTVTDCE